MTSEKLVNQIVEESELSEEQLKEEVEEKMEEFSGLVSEEGAIHLVAKEHGIELAKAEDQDLKVKNIVPEMRNVNLKARIVNILEPNTFEREDGEEGKVQNIVIGDDTGTIRVTLWDEQTQIAEKVEEGDAINITGAYTVEDDRGNAEIRLGDDAQVKMAEEDQVPEVQTRSTETTETDIRGVMNENANYKLKGMIMNIYTSNPFYHTCPECGTSVREDDSENYACPDHGEVEPDKALAISAVLDDGTDNIRTVFFREDARKLLEIEEDEELTEDKIEKKAGQSVGKELQIEGRTRYNDYFGRLEIIANEMEEINAQEELEQLLELMEA